MPTVTGTRGVSNRQVLATIPGNITNLFFYVTPAPQDGDAPGWLNLEYLLSGVSYSLFSQYVPHRGVAVGPIGASGATKQVVMYWRGRTAFGWTLTY